MVKNFKEEGRLCVRLEPKENHAKLKAYAVKNNTSINELVNLAVDMLLKKFNK